MKTYQIVVSKDRAGKRDDGIARSARSMLIFVLPYFVGKTNALGVKTRSYLAFPYGPLTIATYANRNSRWGSKVIIEDLNLCGEDIDLPCYVRDRIAQAAPDIVGYSFMFDTSFPHLRDLSEAVRTAFPNLIQVVGGAAATTGYREILESVPWLDAACYSEGERAILDALDASEDIRTFLLSDPWVTRQTLAKKPGAYYVDSLDDVVDLDYAFVDAEKYSMRESFSPFATYRYEENVRQFFLVTSRGCPFKCTFCAEPSLHGENMRYASVPKIVEHVAKLKSAYGVNVLTIYDDQLLLNVRRAKDLFRELARFDLRIEMPNGVTAVFIDDELADLMKAAGVDTIPLAIESGSEYVLRELIKKPLRIPKLREVMKSLRRAGIFVQGFFVIGMPGETDAHRQETLDLIRDLDLDWASFSVASPVRGSELYEMAKAKGWLPKEYSVGDFVGNAAVMNIPGVDNEAIFRSAMESNLVCNFINNRAMRIGDYETAHRLFQEVSERASQHAYAHYFLGLAAERLGKSQEAAANFDEAKRIAIERPIWLKYAGGFLAKQEQFASAAQAPV